MVVETELATKTHVVRWLESAALGTSYVDVVERVAAVDERCRAEGETMLVVDHTGVGRAVLDMLRRRLKGSVFGVTISGGDAVTHPSPYESVVPKRDLVSAVEVVLQRRALVVLRGLRARQTCARS